MEGVHCYGHLPPEKGRPLTLFERKNGVQIIHEWTSKWYKIYERPKNGRKNLYKALLVKRLVNNLVY